MRRDFIAVTSNRLEGYIFFIKDIDTVLMDG